MISDSDSASIGGAGGNGTLTSTATFTQDFYIKYIHFYVTSSGNYKSGSYVKIYINGTIIYSHDWVSGLDLNIDADFTDLFESILLKNTGENNEIKIVTRIFWDGASQTYKNSIEVRGYYLQSS